MDKNEPSAVDLPPVIKALRQSLQLTQVQFAKALGITPTSVHRYEAGQSSPENEVLSSLLRLATDHGMDAERELLQNERNRRGGGSLTILGHHFRNPWSLPDRTLLDVRTLASLSLEELNILEATLRLTRSTDENTKAVLAALVNPWIPKDKPSS